MPRFLVWIIKKNYTKGHIYQFRIYIHRLSKSIHFFSYKEILSIKEHLSNEGYYKAIRTLCNYYEEQYPDDSQMMAEIERIRKIAKKPKSSPDIFTPADTALLENLQKLKERSDVVYRFFLGLAFSGVRITEMVMLINNPDKFKVIENGSYKKVLLNLSRRTKNCLFIYLPKWYVPPTRLARNTSTDSSNSTKT